MTQEEKNIAYDELIDQYLHGLMSEKERAVFEQDVKNDNDLRERLHATLLLVEGMRKDGARQNQAQFDAVKSMSEEEFLDAIKPEFNSEDEEGTTAASISTPPAAANRGRWIMWTVGIAAAIALIIAVRPLLFNSTSSFAPSSDNLSVSGLVALVEEYNQPLDNAPKEFESIRDQINNSNNKDALALVDNIQELADDLKISIPVDAGVTKGVDEKSDEPSNTASTKSENSEINYDDYACWYKALAYMKAGEKDKAVEQLNILKENGTDSSLIEKANELLKKIDELK